MRKLVKAWNKIPAGAAVTTDPLEQVVLVDKDRLAHLEQEGHFGEASKRPIPAEVRTSSSRVIGRTLDEDGGINLGRSTAPPAAGLGGKTPPEEP